MGHKRMTQAVRPRTTKTCFVSPSTFFHYVMMEGPLAHQ
jgi:hypothetical protein